MKFELIGIVITAIAWGCYPLVARSAGAGAGQAFGTFIMMSTGWLVIAAAAWWQGIEVRPSTQGVIRLAAAGALMGAGMLSFNAVASSRRLDASVAIPIMDTAMLIVTVIVAVMVFAEPFTLRKGMGLALLLAGIATLYHS
jgi:drug/metabolite transporter (DMT)-like permease